MRHPRLSALLALATCATLTSGASAATTLNATVGPGFTISVTKAGKRVTTLPEGIYAIRVADRSAAHNFHLIGPGINRRTGVAAVATTTWQVKLRAGTYRFVCDPHFGFMKGTFRVL